MDYLLFLHYIKSKGFELQDVAELIGVSKQVLYRRLKGLLILRREHIAQIAKVLDMDNDRVLKIFFSELKS